MKVLAVDDDPQTLALMEAGLMGAGHDVITARNGEAAWEAFQLHKTPVVVVDWHLPKVDGLELCKRIRAAKLPDYTYVILVAADPGRNRFLRAMQSGIDDFVAKPIDFGILAARLRVAERILHLEHELGRLRKIIPVCLGCLKIQTEDNTWQQVDEYFESHEPGSVSHGFCPKCAEGVRASAKHTSRRAPAEEPVRSERPKILLIDDSVALLAVTQSILEEGGFEVVTRGTGTEGFEAFEAERPRLALVDVSLPDMTGDDVVRGVRANHAFRDVQLLLYSGKSRSELERLTRACDANGFVEKSTKPEDLIALLWALLVPAGQESQDTNDAHLHERRLHALRHALQQLVTPNPTVEAVREARGLAEQLRVSTDPFITDEIRGHAGAIVENLANLGSPKAENSWERINRALEACNLKPIAVPVVRPAPSSMIPNAFPTVLVLDESEAVHQLVIDGLGSAYAVTAVSDPVAALRILEQQPIELVIADLSMKHDTGLGPLAALRQRHLSTDVILCASNPDISTHMHAASLGASAVLSKPTGAELPRVASTILRQASRRLKLGVSPAHLEALKEVFYASVGRAARALSRLLRSEVRLGGARALVLRPSELLEWVTAAMPPNLTVVRNDFSGAVVGTGLMVVPTSAAIATVASLMTHSEETPKHVEVVESMPTTLSAIARETITEIANIPLNPLLRSFAGSFGFELILEELVCEVGAEITADSLVKAAVGEHIITLECYYDGAPHGLHGKMMFLLGSSQLSEPLKQLDRMMA